MEWRRQALFFFEKYFQNKGNYNEVNKKYSKSNPMAQKIIRYKKLNGESSKKILKTMSYKIGKTCQMTFKKKSRMLKNLR